MHKVTADQAACVMQLVTTFQAKFISIAALRAQDWHLKMDSLIPTMLCNFAFKVVLPAM